MRNSFLRKILWLLFSILLSAIFFSCNKNTVEKGKIKILCTTFPQYDWTKNIIGENDKIDISLLNKNGTDLHSFSPSVDDIIKITTCDVLICVGGESEKWVEDALKNKVNKDMVTINLLQVLSSFVKEEEIVEGMETEEEDKDSDEIEYDEHVWLSVKNASIICDYIEKILCEILPEDSESFEKNLISYKNELDLLDNTFAKVCANLDSQTMIFCDRFPFRYFTDDYNLKYYAAFVGCSAESEASFKTIMFLAKKIDELNMKNIYVLDNSDKKIATTVISNTAKKDQKILALDSMQSITEEDIKKGKTYLSIMKRNLTTLENQ